MLSGSFAWWQAACLLWLSVPSPAAPAPPKGKELCAAEKECLAALAKQQTQLAGQPGELSLRLAWCRSRIQLAGIRIQMYKFAEALTDLAETGAVLRELITRHPQDPAPRFELARCHAAAGRCYHQAELLVEAADSLGQAARLLEKLAADFPARAEFREQLGGILLERGDVLMWLARFQESEVECQQALRQTKRLVAEAPNSPTYAEHLANAYNGYALLVREQGRFPEAAELIREAISLFRRIKEEHPKQPHLWRSLPTMYRNLAQPLGYVQDAAGERAARRQADRLEEEIARCSAENKTRPVDNHRLTGEIITGGNLSRLAGGREEAENGLREAQKLLAEHPAVPFYRSKVAASEVCLAAQRLANAAPEEARTHLQNACASFAKLAADFPKIPAYRMVLASTQTALGAACALGNHPTEGRQYLQEGFDGLAKLADDYPRVARFRYLLSTAFLQNATLQMGRREQREAVRDLSHALEVMARLAKDFPTSPQFRRHLADHQGTLAGWQEALGDLAAAEKALRECLRLWGRIAADNPSVSEYRLSWGNAQSRLGVYLTQHKRVSEAVEAYSEAIRIHQRLCNDFPKDALAPQCLAGVYLCRGQLHEGQNRLPDALKDYSQALAYVETALRLAPQRRDWIAHLKYILQQRGTVLLALGRQQEYERDMRRADEVQERMQDPQLRLIDLSRLVEDGDLARTRAAADDLSFDEGLTGPRWYELAMIYAKLAARETAPAQKESAAAAAARALRKAREDGYTWTTALSDDPVFRSLTGRTDFKSLEKPAGSK
jgi:tetratricopeptide (TPR) repeat protein